MYFKLYKNNETKKQKQKQKRTRKTIPLTLNNITMKQQYTSNANQMRIKRECFIRRLHQRLARRRKLDVRQFCRP